jgi:ribosomal protein L5
MNGVIYRMSKERFNNLKYPMRYVKGKMVRSNKGLSTKEILEEANKTFGLKNQIVKIEVI